MFSKNLGQLAKTAASISALAHELSLNRTQLNRLLSGESFPKPDVLQRICDRFNVDARILTHPLDSLPTFNEEAYLKMMSQVFGSRRDREYRKPMTPDGFYLLRRRSLLTPDMAVVRLVLLYTQQGLTRWRGTDTVHPSVSIDRLPHHMNRYWGLVAPCLDGINVMLADRGGVGFNAAYFGPLPGPYRSLFAGFFVVLAPNRTHEIRLTGATLQQIPSETGQILASARQCGFYRAEELPQFHRGVLFERVV